MNHQNNPATATCPVTTASVRETARTTFEHLVACCESSDSSCAAFERELLVRLATLGACLLRLFLTARHERLDLQPFLADQRYRAGEAYATRTLKTCFGEVAYGRQYLQARAEGRPGFFPLDVVLGLTDDRLSPWVMQWVARLATRMSFKAAQMVCRAVLHWAPATETIEQVVLGLGRDAAPFMRQLPAPANDGEVLVIEVDGKCPPTATAAELAKRRGRRRPRPADGCRCGCQRHRGRCQRLARGPKKRRKKGDKSKNGKEAVVVVMYTLRRDDGQLHGPLNKKLYATFAGRKAAAQWARAEAKKRGFGPDTTKTVQIVVDGATSLKEYLKELFPNAIFTLDVCHVVERLWKLGRHFHKEGSAALTAWVDELKALVYAGRVEALLDRLRAWWRVTAKHGPGTRARRQALKEQIGYFERRQEMMQYDRWLMADLVIASGQVEGAVRHLVGERLDCSGMRWIQGKAEAVLQLRCIELNGDWDKFVKWHQRWTRVRLQRTKRHKILTDQPLSIRRAA